MSTEDIQNEELVQDELATLKARADMLGIAYHPSISAAKLRDKIAAKLADQPDPEAKAQDAGAKGQAADTENESEGARRLRMKRECEALVRVNIMCMNPAKKEWEGEIFTVGNSVVPTQRKFVPFNTPEGYHIPKIMLDMLQQRQCQIFTNQKTRNGVTIRQPKLIKEFAIEILPPLTDEERLELARVQAMRNGQSA